MVDKIENLLTDLRESLEADGYELGIDSTVPGKIELKISATPRACEDCLVPKELLEEMIKVTLEELEEPFELVLRYPNE